MMRVLMLLRQSRGGMMSYAETLRNGLRHRGVEAVIDDATDWIPKETGWLASRSATRAVKDAVRGFDVVHAFGYRCAWACSEAFYLKFPWLYTAYDMPKTTNSQLIDRLNAARMGLCTTRAVMQALVEVECLNLSVVNPCVPIPDVPDEKPDGFTILMAGRTVPERGWKPALETLESLMQERLDIRLFAAPLEEPPAELGRLEARYPGRVLVERGPAMIPALIAASSLVLVPSTRAGFSMLAAEAMAMERPVLMRRVDGLTEMAVDAQSAFYYDNDAALRESLSQIIDAPLARESVAQSARVRAEVRFDTDEGVRSVFEAYRMALGIE